MKIKLLHHSPLWLASHTIRMSHDNHDKSDTVNTDDLIGTKDKAIIARVGNKLKHKSVLEQLVYWFDIDGISRACLQELARHRTFRITVKSSRYTLNELKTTSNFMDYLVPIDAECNLRNVAALRAIAESTSSNDYKKYMLPEAFKTRLQLQCDGRNLQNFLELRTSKDALWEIQNLARGIYEALPREHKYLYEEYINV